LFLSNGNTLLNTHAQNEEKKNNNNQTEGDEWYGINGWHVVVRVFYTLLKRKSHRTLVLPAI
jgi:hypothetical protein